LHYTLLCVYAILTDKTMQQKSVAELVRGLRAFCEDKKISDSELARRTGVPQSTVHRILHSPRSDRVTSRLKELCKYANISLEITAMPDPAHNGVMMSALREIWDGSDAGARAIATMLLAARELCLPVSK
jgi:transcriptional regulator with XRE-family HTH domain